MDKAAVQVPLITEMPRLPTFNPTDWASACRSIFTETQPDLADQIWDDVWEAVPYAYRLWVVCRKRLDMMGGLHIPDSAKRTQQEGWVVSVGWSICDPDPHTGQRSPYESPLDLVGRRVFWGAYTGTDLVPSERPDRDAPKRNQPQERQYLSLSIADIMGESLRKGGTVL